jgi:pimeloyl-ACP methyl ester carboxylesterase
MTATARESEVVLQSGSDRIHATFAHGRARGRRPAAVLVHGFGAFRDELTGFSEMAAKLADAGISSLRPDMRGCGKSGSRGLMQPMWDWVEDVRAAISWLEVQSEVEPERIGVIGMSMGGGVACTTAAFDRRIKAVVALAPVVDGEAWLRHLWMSARGEEAWHDFRAAVAEDRQRRALKKRSRMVRVEDVLAFTPLDRKNFLKMARDYPQFLRRVALSAADSVMRTDVVPLAPMIAPRPLLVVHSTADSVVPPTQGRALARAAKKPVELLLVDDSPHCFWISPESERVQLASVDWLAAHL